MGAHYVFSMYHIESTLPRFSFAACSYHLYRRIAIVFSLLSSAPNSSISHSYSFLISSSNTSSFLLKHFTFSHCVSSTLYCFAARAYLSGDLVPPPSGYWYTSFFFLAVPGPLHEIAVSAFSRSPLGRDCFFHSYSFPQSPVLENID